MVLPESIAVATSGTSPDFVIIALKEKRNNQREKKASWGGVLKRRKNRGVALEEEENHRKKPCFDTMLKDLLPSLSLHTPCSK